MYRDVARLGRKTRLAENQRALLWTIFEQARAGLAAQQRVTIPGVFRAATEHLDATADRPYDFAVIDEAQDIGVPQLRFLAALAGDRSDGLFFAGDLGQRIFQTPFSWRALGVDVRGRSQTLRINYRTSHQIRRQADRLLPAELADVDENTEVRRGTVSAFNGPEPMIEVLDSEANETAAIATWLRARRADGIVPDEMGVFVRSDAELPRAIAAVEAAGLTPFILDGESDGGEGCVAVSTMHHASKMSRTTPTSKTSTTPSASSSTSPAPALAITCSLPAWPPPPSSSTTLAHVPRFLRPPSSSGTRRHRRSGDSGGN